MSCATCSCAGKPVKYWRNRAHILLAQCTEWSHDGLMFSSYKVVRCTSESIIVIYCAKNPLVGNGGPDASRANGTGGCERREDPPRHGRPAAGLVQHPPGPPRTVSALPPSPDEGAGPPP